MPEACVVCGEQDFQETGGMFYCTTCNTQSQSMRVMMLDEEDDPTGFTGLTAVIREKKPESVYSKKKVIDKGRPWSLYEAYQVIIQHQVEALLNLGAHPQLKDIVFKIWVKYLSQLGVAFSDKPPNPALDSLMRQRELFPPTTKNPKVKNILGRRSRLQTLGMSAKKYRKQMEMEELKDAMEDEDFYDEDNPLKAQEDILIYGSGSSDEEDDEEEENVERWGRCRKGLHTSSMYKMQLKYTLGFCYLGLMYTNPLTTVTDLIRWVKQKRVPFIDVKGLLPDDLKFCFNDWKYFMGVVPKVDTLRLLTGSLADFLSLSDFPKFPVQQLISKYLIQLDLPAGLHSYAIHIFHVLDPPLVYTPMPTCKKIPFWEGLAMSCIIITMRIIFGLNNHAERMFSVVSREIMKLIDKRHQLFVYDDWMAHMKTKLYLQQFRDEGTEHNQQKSTPKSIMESKKQRLYQAKVRAGLAKPFFILEENLRAKEEIAATERARRPFINDTETLTVNKSSSQINTFRNQSVDAENQSKKTGAQSSIAMCDTDAGSDPLMREYPSPDHSTTEDFDFNLNTGTLMEDDPVGFLLGYHENEIGNREELDEEEEEEADIENTAGNVSKYMQCKLRQLARKGEFFHKTGFQHILFPKTYLETLEENGMMEGSISSSCSSEQEEDLDDTITDNHKKPTANVKTSLRKYMEANDEAGSPMSNVVNLERYNCFIEQICKLRQTFELQLDESPTDEDSGLSALLEVCSQIIDCERKMLKDEVRKQEIILLADSRDFIHSKKKNTNIALLKKNANQCAFKRVVKF